MDLAPTRECGMTTRADLSDTERLLIQIAKDLSKPDEITAFQPDITSVNLFCMAVSVYIDSGESVDYHQYLHQLAADFPDVMWHEHVRNISLSEVAQGFYNRRVENIHKGMLQFLKIDRQLAEAE